MKRIRKRPVAPHRRGAFLVVALVCLVVATALIAALLTQVETHRKQLEQQQLRLQAEWLAESALDRAVAQLRADPAYAGETLLFDPADMGGPDGAQIVIRVEVSPDRKDPLESKNQRAVRAEAIYPAGSNQAVRRTRQTTIALSQES